MYCYYFYALAGFFFFSGAPVHLGPRPLLIRFLYLSHTHSHTHHTHTHTPHTPTHTHTHTHTTRIHKCIFVPLISDDVCSSFWLSAVVSVKCASSSPRIKAKHKFCVIVAIKVANTYTFIHIIHYVQGHNVS